MSGDFNGKSSSSQRVAARIARFLGSFSRSLRSSPKIHLLYARVQEVPPTINRENDTPHDIRDWIATHS